MAVDTLTAAELKVLERLGTQGKELLKLAQLIDDAKEAATQLNAQITAYTNLMAKLNADTGVTDTDFGTGGTAPADPVTN